MNTKIITSALILAMSMAGCASAANNDRYRYNDNYYADQSSYTDEAEVLRSTPIYESVRVNVPETRCWNERVYHPESSGSNDSYTPTIAGGILGGVVGNQFGKGKGKDVMTLAGVILGSSIGNDLRTPANRRHAYSSNEQRCETVDHFEEKNELVGYNVRYRYQGKNYSTRMSSNPGDYIKVNVSVEPVRF